MADKVRDAGSMDNTQNGELDERKVRAESSKAAQQAQEAKREAYKLRQAAHGAADPEERQKLLERAIDKEVEAESFGKTAKYLRGGAFQGMAVGTGIGVVPGATLGTLTGTLVGGVVSTITGGLGAGLGALTGWLHGPFWNMGEVMGKGVQKVTGNLPGWKATEDQKRTLEEMIGQVNEEEMPDDTELEQLREDGANEWWDGKTAAAKGYVPSMPTWMKSKNGDEGKNDKVAQGNKVEGKSQPKQRPPQTPQDKNPQSNKINKSPTSRRPTSAATQRAGDDLARHLKDQENVKPNQKTTVNKKPNASGGETAGADGDQEQRAQMQSKKTPRKLEVRSVNSAQGPPPNRQRSDDKKPRKLERRS